MPVRLRLLGEVQVRWSGESLLPPTDRRLGLLAYLACAGGWVDRDRLAWLFWPDVTSSRARTNLRGLLARARREPYADGVEAERTRVQWIVDCDVAAFRRAVAEEAWSDALRAYGGTFFGGADLDGVGELGSWIEDRRRHLHGEYRRAVLARAGASGVAGADGDLLLPVLDALLEDDPFDEPVARQAIRLREAQGRRDEARSLAETFARRLREELDAEPTEETRRILRGLSRPSARRADAEVPGVPAPLTPFVGREAERRDLAVRLTGGACRILTLTGPGGVGKTRLALEVARELADRFPDGAHVVRAGPAPDAQGLATAVADAMGLRLTADEAAERIVLRSLASARPLLVLDEMEGALAAVPWLLDVLSRCPDVTLLITSRRRLELPGEWVVRLAGLERPAAEASPEGARATDAVRLFLDVASRVDPRFAPGEDELAAVSRICRTVGGLPLALELAAPWVRVLPVDELARELDDDLELLHRAPHGEDDRHHSVRAAFEYSWARLPAAEAEVFAALATFRGRFRRDAAAAVAGAGIPALASLVDASLLRLSRDGSYERHPLLLRYAREKAAERPALERQARERHAAWFADWIEATLARFERTADVTLARATTEAYADLIGVLDEAIEAADVVLAARITTSLVWYWIWRGRPREGRAWIDRVLAMPLGERDPARARLLVLTAVLSGTSGEYGGCRALVLRAYEVARAHGDRPLEIDCLNSLGFLGTYEGALAEAARHFEQGLALADDESDPATRTILLINAGFCAVRMGDEARARDLLGQGCERARRAGNGKQMGIAHLHLGRLERQLGNPRAARARLDEAAAYLKALGHVDLVARVDLHEGMLALVDEDRPAAAAPLLRASLASWWESAATGRIPDVLRAVAALCARTGRVAAAAYLWSAADAASSSAEGSLLLPSESAAVASAVEAVRRADGRAFAAGTAAGAGAGTAAAVEFGLREAGRAA